ncbi:MAG: hypothetical protein QG549_751 [Patescibacteria group bacterium]|nr:hypothetical protein [Patescibacteria group bacterium]
MADKAVYCCEIFAVASGLPRQFVKKLFPEPAQDLESYATQRTLLDMELDMMNACEHYRNQSIIVHRDACDYLLSADIKMAEYLGLTIDQYRSIITDPNS